MLKRLITAGMGAGVALVMLTGCVPVQPMQDPPNRPDTTSVSLDGKRIKEGGDLKMALSSEPDKLDPTTSSSLYTRYVMQTMCQKLYDIDAQGEIVPQLATALPKSEAGGKRVTIPVRTDAKFADGTAFNGEAVKTTLERGINLKSSKRKSELGPITKITASSDAVVIDFEKPYAPFTAALADRAGMIMSPKALADQGEDFSNNPVCVGPFKFVERIPQTSIKVERDPLYYDAQNVHLDSVTYQIMTDANIRAANIRSQDVQVADTISPQDIDALQKEGIGTLQVGSLGYQGVTVNIGNQDGVGQPAEQIDSPMAKDVRVRRAFAKAIDRPALTNAVFNGWYEPACSFMPAKSPFSSPAAQQCVEHDPEGAKKLLKEAGVSLPMKIEIKVSNAQDTLRYAQALQAQIKDAGFDLKVTPMEYTALLDAQDKGDFDLIYLGWSGRIDPNDNSAKFFQTGAGNNYAGVSDGKLDELFDRAASLVDDKQRSVTYGQIVERLNEVLPTVYLYRQRNLTAYTNEVSGIDVYADGVVHLSNAAFVEDDA
ncbi:ABC transporter substrate-binding protein [Brevibacterium sp. 50QC2O2]|uniref:ABC transporter substrate-binding protein n=1 Tax=Brevibacterium sp. 50QC2O2 TaxID=2968459 RepID=UPI00211CC9F6|nr:ABC transporter substrate-binding protein [Brevibacterium sp. 50QC2O2]